MIEVAQVDANAQNTAYCEANGSINPPRKRFLSNRINKESERHQSDDEEEIIAHLDMIAEYLHRCEEARDHDSQQVFPPVTQHHTSDGWWDEAERQEFPDVSCLDDDEVVTTKRPKDCAESRHPNTEVEGSEHNVEAEQHHEDVSGIGREARKSELIDALQSAECLSTTIAGAHLISRHSAEERVCPARSFAIMSRSVLFHLHTAADAAGVVMSRQDQPITNRHDEIHYADGHEKQDGQHIGKKRPPNPL